MAKFTVFYKNQIEEECDDWPPCPCTGSFIRIEEPDQIIWARTTGWGKHALIKRHQVPDNYKAICLLLNLPI